MDKPDTPALNNDAEGEISEPATPADETTATGDGTEPEVEATAKAEGEAHETVEGSKKGANARIRELNTKAHVAEERAKNLEERLAELTGRDRPYEYTNTQYQPHVEPGAEVTPEQYKQDVANTANSIVMLQIEQNNAVNRIHNEAQEVLRTHPELDPENDAYNKDLSDSVTEATLAYVKANPYSASPKAFVNRLMKPYKQAVTKEVGQERENIARQVSQTALRPTAVTKGEKPDSELTTEELEKKYGIVY